MALLPVRKNGKRQPMVLAGASIAVAMPGRGVEELLAMALPGTTAISCLHENENNA